MASALEDITGAVIRGGPEAEVKTLTQRAVDDGYEASEILHNGLIRGIEAVGSLWKRGEAYIPEVLLSAHAMYAGMNVLKELLVKSGTKPLAKVVFGTVQGDVHDIGKSIVSMMMGAVGFDVKDLGVDVAAERFVEAAKAQEAQMICMSALLTTTMPKMERTIRALEKAGLQVITMVGGAPVSKAYAERIGATAYAPDAVAAVDKAKELLGIKGR